MFYTLSVCDTALDDASCRAYLAGQQRTLERYGAEGAAPKGLHAATAGRCYIVVAQDASGQMVGGSRLHRRRHDAPLPTELALADAIMCATLERASCLRPVELCGVWVDPAHRKTGLSQILYLADMALARTLGARFGCGSGHRKVMPFYGPFGTLFDTDRPYPYPDARYETFVAWVDLDIPLLPQHPARNVYRWLLDTLDCEGSFHTDPSHAGAWRAQLESWTQERIRREGTLERLLAPFLAELEGQQARA